MTAVSSECNTTGMSSQGSDLLGVPANVLGCSGTQAQHLAHWGINRMLLHKTEKTMAELQIDLNMAFEFDKITEKGSALQPVYGPGYAKLPPRSLS